jgi:rRNA small subunit pseudouridine methyltransferase Nep1
VPVYVGEIRLTFPDRGIEIFAWVLRKNLRPTFSLFCSMPKTQKQQHGPSRSVDEDIDPVSPVVRPATAPPRTSSKTDASLVPIPASVPRTAEEKQNTRRLYVVLCQASLEVYKTGKAGDHSGKGQYQLLNCDDHQGALRRMGRDIGEARPDITHQVCPFRLLI